MTKKFAVIDLGTNTFHLLIAEKNSAGTFKELYRNRIFVNLAENGIHTIHHIAFERGIAAIFEFKKTLEDYQVDLIKALGTAALRTADNGKIFIEKIFSETGINVKLIQGDREAELIYKGVRQAVDFEDNSVLIMDIGGGSVEFIIANKDGVNWAESFPVGASVLFNDFHKTDPISHEEIDLLLLHFEKQLSPLLEKIETYSPNILIGASGTFDVLENLLCKEKISEIHGIVQISDFYPFYEKLSGTTLQERYEMSEIPDSRAKMIIVALILIHFVLKKAPIQKISVSAYAMKEGMLMELIEKEKSY